MREMKDSGYSWLGNIPDNWALKRGKYLFVQRSSRGNAIELQLLSPTQKFGVIPQSMYEELTGMSAVKLNDKTDLSLLKTIHKGDFCISLRSFQGGFEYSEYEGVVSPAYQVFYPLVTIADGYYKYLFKDTGFVEKMNSYTMTLRDGKNIAFSDFGDTYIPYPSVEEQQAIAAYLDRKCDEIDTLTADIETQIETLEQYKRSVITEAVTKGLNPDAEMKNSGIEWIGEVPKHWGISQLKFYVESITDVDHYMPESIGKGIPYVMTGDLKDQFSLISFEECKQISEEDFNQLIRKSNIKIGNVIFARYATIGTVCYVDAYRDCVISYSCVNITPGQRLNGYFLFYYLKSNSFEEDVSKFVNSNTQGNVGIESLKQSQISVPPFEEQKEIANYLDHKCTEIDGIIANKQTQLDTLAEYKKSLIYEYVTGKKEVPV